jgi:xylose isomerase
MSKEWFPFIKKVEYEGPTSKNPLAFKWYNAEEKVLLSKKKKKEAAFLPNYSSSCFTPPAAGIFFLL